jgi:hypothetical protein
MRLSSWRLALPTAIVMLALGALAEDQERSFSGTIAAADFARSMLPPGQREQVGWEPLLRPLVKERTTKIHRVTILEAGRIEMSVSVKGKYSHVKVDSQSGGLGRNSYSWHDAMCNTFTPSVQPGTVVFTVVPSETTLSNPDRLHIAACSYEIRTRFIPESRPATTTTGRPPPTKPTPPTTTRSAPIGNPPPTPPIQSTPPSGDPSGETVFINGDISSLPPDTPIPLPWEDKAATGAAAATAGALTVFGVWLMMRSSGVRFADMKDAWREWLKSQPSAPPATVIMMPPRGRDGEYNDRGEVWSDEDKGWIDPRLYEEERARRRNLDAKAEADLHTGQSADVKEAYDKWVRSRNELQRVRQEGMLQDKRWQAEEFLDRKLQELVDKEKTEGMDENRRQFIDLLQDKAKAIEGIEDNAEAVRDLTGLAGTVLHQKERGYTPTYTYEDAIFDTTAQVSAAALDFAVTRGLASASVNAAIAARNATRAGQNLGQVYYEATTSVYRDFVIGQAIRGAASAAGKAWQWYCGGTPVVQEAVENAAPNAARQARAAVAREAEKRAMAKLPPSHPARQIGAINEALSKSKGYDPRLISATRRLDPSDSAYQKALDALKSRSERGAEYDRLLRPETKKAMDAVRHDLDLRSRERALQMMGEEHPELKGKITSFDNTGSHARKGLNYRGLDSDVDHTPGHDGTVQGRQAAEKFGEYQDKALRELTDSKLGAQDLKINSYGNNRGPGAFQSGTGLKVKELYDQGSGRIDVVQGDRITHQLRGADVVEQGKEWTRWSTGTAAGDQKQVQALCGDYLQKFEAEKAIMGSSAEELKQAAKGYYHCRVFESKSIGGRALAEDAALIEQAKNIKELSHRLSESEQREMARQFLDAMKQRAYRE